MLVSRKNVSLSLPTHMRTEEISHLSSYVRATYIIPSNNLNTY